MKPAAALRRDREPTQSVGCLRSHAERGNEIIKTGRLGRSLALPGCPPGPGASLLLGHFDTVWPVGQIAKMPLVESGGRLHGPGVFDTVSVMEKWVEQGQAPDEIVASHLSGGAVDRTRPLCAYPKVARYKGSGSTDEAANFVCKLP